MFRGVLPLFGGVPLFRHSSGVFCCSAGVPCSGVPGFIVCCFFSLLLHDKHFVTNENNSDRTDESNTPFHNTIHRLVWWVGWIHFLFSSLFSRKTAFDLLAFCSLHSVIKLRYFWWNYFLNNVHLLVGFVETSLFVDGRSLCTYSHFIIMIISTRRMHVARYLASYIY